MLVTPLNTWQKVSQTQLLWNLSSLCKFKSYIPAELFPWNAEFLKNLLFDTFVFRIFNIQNLRGCLQIFIASISHRDLMKKSWIKLYTISSLSCFMECSMNEFILPFLINDSGFSLHPTLKNNCDDISNCLKQPDLH